MTNRVLLGQHGGSRITYSQWEAGTTGWMIRYATSGVTTGTAFTGVNGTTPYYKLTPTINSTGQTFSLGTATGYYIAVTAGEVLYCSVGVELQVPSGGGGTYNAVLWWYDANGNSLSNSSFASGSAPLGFNTQLAGYLTVPANAHTAALEIYMSPSGTGSYEMALTNPMVCTGFQNRVPYSQWEAGTTGWAERYWTSGVSSGTPFTGVNPGTGLTYYKIVNNVTGTGQTFSLGTVQNYAFPVVQGERLSVQLGAEVLIVSGPSVTWNLSMWFLDINGNQFGQQTVQSGTAPISFNTQVGGFFTVPTNAVKAIIEFYVGAGGTGQYSLALTLPQVCSAPSGVTALPSTFNWGPQYALAPFMAGPTTQNTSMVGLFISKPGVDVTTATMDQMIFDSRIGYYASVVASGTATAGTTITFPQLPYIPMVMVSLLGSNGAIYGGAAYSRTMTSTELAAAPQGLGGAPYQGSQTVRNPQYYVTNNSLTILQPTWYNDTSSTIQNYTVRYIIWRCLGA